jgi:hypothetical protein
MLYTDSSEEDTMAVTTTRETIQLQRIWSAIIRSSSNAETCDTYPVHAAVDEVNDAGLTFGTVAWYAAVIWVYNQS